MGAGGFRVYGVGVQGLVKSMHGVVYGIVGRFKCRVQDFGVWGWAGAWNFDFRAKAQGLEGC